MEGGELIDSFGKGIQLSTEVQSELAEKMIHASQTVGEEGAGKLKTALDNALTDAGDKAGVFAGILNGMNWSSAEAWEQLPEMLESADIDTTTDAF
jgi:hypothetical protein